MSLINNLKIRYACIDDVKAISYIEDEGFKYENRISPFGCDYDELCQLWIKRIKHKQTVVLVCLYQDKIVGFISVLNPVHKGFINAIYVHYDYFGQGVGTFLLSACEQIIKNAGGNKISAQVEPLNKVAHSFYLKHKFKIYNSSKTYLLTCLKKI